MKRGAAGREGEPAGGKPGGAARPQGAARSVKRSGAKSIVAGVCLLLLLMVIASFGGRGEDSMNEKTVNGGTDGLQGAGTTADGLGYQSVPMEEVGALLEELKQEGTSYVLLDVRTEAEFEDGHIPGAICLPNEEIAADTPAAEQARLKETLPDLSAKVLVYCRSGNRSIQAATKLANLGYTDIVECGGIMDWTGELESIIACEG